MASYGACEGASFREIACEGASFGEMGIEAGTVVEGCPSMQI